MTPLAARINTRKLQMRVCTECTPSLLHRPNRWRMRPEFLFGR